MPSQICLNCSNQFDGKYCNNCGEKVYTDHDKSVAHIFHEGFHFVTHFEGTFFNTLKAIVLKPGKLSLDYCSGIRKRYFKPLSFFLMLVILYLLFPFFESLNMKLRYHKDSSIYGTYAIEKADKIKSARNISDEELEQKFHQKGEKTSKFLLFIIIPCMAFY